MFNLRKSAPENLLATVVAIMTFLGATLMAGFGQTASSSGASTFKTNCVSCHGADGRGSAVGKSLQVADLHSAQVQQQSDAQLAQIISNGQGNMPPFGSSLSQSQIAALVKYIRHFKS